MGESYNQGDMLKYFLRGETGGKIDEIKRSLEKTASELSKKLPLLGITKMPEYQEALDAIQKYADKVRSEASKLKSD